MTTERRNAAESRAIGQSSTLPFDPRELMQIRILPAQFARMMGVSKQSVSQWIKQGKIVLGPDGKMDPAAATRQLIGNTEPSRMRARFIKAATQDHDELRQRIAEQERELAGLREQIAAVPAKLARSAEAGRFQADDHYAQCITQFCGLIESRAYALPELARAGTLSQFLELMAGEVFYGLSEDELRAAALDMGE